MTHEELLSALDNTLSELLQLVASFSQEELNAEPFPGSWTAGQVARHLVLSNGGFEKILTGPGEEAARPYDAAVETLHRVFTDFTTKMTAPGFVEPPATVYEKGDLLAAHQKIKSGLLEGARSVDLTKIRTAFELPRLGYLTGWEALHFVLYHTRRHMRQLEGIRELVTAGKLRD